jgi:hypothetical protein
MRDLDPHAADLLQLARKLAHGDRRRAGRALINAFTALMSDADHADRVWAAEVLANLPDFLYPYTVEH